MPVWPNKDAAHDWPFAVDGVHSNQIKIMHFLFTKLLKVVRCHRIRNLSCFVVPQITQKYSTIFCILIVWHCTCKRVCAIVSPWFWLARRCSQFERVFYIFRFYFWSNCVQTIEDAKLQKYHSSRHIAVHWCSLIGLLFLCTIQMVVMFCVPTQIHISTYQPNTAPDFGTIFLVLFGWLWWNSHWNGWNKTLTYLYGPCNAT